MAPRATSLIDAMLLLLLAEQPGTSGYTLDALVEQRGYRAWAGIGSSSIYARLRKLEQRGWATSRPGTEKRGRGPIPRLFTLTHDGGREALSFIRTGLSTTREHDPRFNLALSGMELVGHAEVMRCLQARRRFLQAEHARVSTLSTLPHNHSRPAQLLFSRSLHAIAAELSWLETVQLTESPRTHSILRDGQRCVWEVERLWKEADHLAPFDCPLTEFSTLWDLDIWYGDRNTPTVGSVLEHLARIEAADLAHPIILSDTGVVMDGIHRLCKARLQGHTTIRAVRFPVTPQPHHQEPWPRE